MLAMLKIRALSESDSAGLEELILGSYGNGGGMWFSEKPNSHEAKSVVSMKLRMLKEGTLIDNIALLDGEVVGDCEVVLDKGIGLLGIVVNEKHRNSDIGRALLIETLKKAVALGVKTVFAEVDEGNYSAISFFTKNGFAIAGSGPTLVARNGKESSVMRLLINL